MPGQPGRSSPPLFIPRFLRWLRTRPWAWSYAFWSLVYDFRFWLRK